jgi:hypothetical protein
MTKKLFPYKSELKWLDYFECKFGVKKMTRDKNGRCHDDEGHLTSCGSGSGGAPSQKPKYNINDLLRRVRRGEKITPAEAEALRQYGSSKPAPEEKPKEEPVDAKDQKPPRNIEGFDPKQKHEGPRGAGQSNYPNVKPHAQARKRLAPYVGKEVDISYKVSNFGKNPAGKTTMCVKDVKIAGTNVTLDHMWIPSPSPEQLKLRPGDAQTATGRVGEYLKERGKWKDYEVGSLSNIKTVTARGSRAGEEFVPEEERSTESLEPYDMAITESHAFKMLHNEQGIPEQKALDVVTIADDTVGKTKVANMKTMTFASIPEPSAMAQCELSFWDDAQEIRTQEVLKVDMSPEKREVADRGWDEDQTSIKAGKIPWLASGYAEDKDSNFKGLINHEVGHAIMGEHTCKQPQKEWINPDNPLLGTQEWYGVLEDAAIDGWAGASLYGRVNTGEMFAECFALLTVKNTTGNKQVDDYVLKVAKNG